MQRDRWLLVVGTIVVLLGLIASMTGIARPPFAAVARAAEGGVASLIFTVGFLAWYPALIYIFSAPGWRNLAHVLIPSTVGTALLYLGVFKSKFPDFAHSLLIFGLLGCFLGFITLLKALYERRFSLVSGEYREKLDTLLFASIVILFLGAIETYRDITASLHPETFDLLLYHFESTMGFSPSAALGSIAEAVPTFKTIIESAYAGMPLGFAVLIGAQLARRNRPSINILTAWFVVALLAMLGYHLLPAAGPKYLFGQLFPGSLPAADDLVVSTTLVMPSARNAVPSMHFGWALMLWLNACLLGSRWLRAAFAVLLGLNVLATIGLGEHYLVDLVIAVPVIVAVQAFGMSALSWNDPLRRRAIVWGLALWIIWVIALRFGVPVFKAVPGLSWTAVAVTMGLSIWLYLPLVRAFERAWATGQKNPRPTAATKPVFGSEVRTVAAMFILSGFAGIMYEVLFSKALALTFGSTATATYTVLATYMGGMALGSWLGGRLASGRDNPLVLYAFCEVGIAIYCAATPVIFKGIQALYIGLATGTPPDAEILTLFRLLLGIVGLLLPTVLMGMTLPILARFFEGRARSLGGSVAVLYGANTVGAALGALMAGYFVIPALGVRGTTFAAVLLNLLVALMAIGFHKRLVGKRLEADRAPAVMMPSADLAHGADQVLDLGGIRRLGHIALAILGVGGIVTLALETNYIHLLAVVAGNSTYAFSLMLFTFLLGLGAGAEVARRLLKRSLPLPLLLGWLEFGLAIVILGGVFLWAQMPPYFGSFASYPVTLEFGAREVVRGVVCWLAMFPPAFFIGAIYPVAMEGIGRANIGSQIQALGRAAGLNTLGNIVGVLLGGFVLLPYLGALRSVQLLAAVCIVLGAIAFWHVGRRWRPAVWAPAAVAGLLIIVQPASFNYTSLASGANVYFAPQDWGEIVDHAESIDGGLTSVALKEVPGQPPLRTLLTNGKFQGNNSSGGEMQAQLGFALSPLLHTPHRDRALVIGYGTGVSTRTLHEAGFKQLDVVELSADIIRLANKHFESVNARVTEKPRVNTYVTDGRNFLMLQDRQYDVVGLEISSIWFAGAASLYNREFYQLVKKRLRPEGVLQQWMQLHHVNNFDVLRILGSVRAEFEYVWLYEIGGQGIIIASNDPRAVPNSQNVALLSRTPTLAPLLAILKDDPGKLLDARLLDPSQTDRLLSAFGVPAWYWVSTDDNLYLEYSTPKGNVLDGRVSPERNKQFIARYSREGGAKPVSGAHK